MTNERRKSDKPVLPMKSSNKTGPPVAERMEGRGLARGSRNSKTRPGHRAGATRPVRWSGYDKQQRKIRRCGSLRSFIKSTRWKH